MIDIVEFIKARLREDESAALGPGSTDWRIPFHGVIVDRDVDGWQSAPDASVIVSYRLGDEGFAADHIVRHDPGRVLREVAAKRAMLDNLADEILGDNQLIHNDRGVGTCKDEDSAAYMLLHQLLAAPYSDHPDYDPTWSQS